MVRMCGPCYSADNHTLVAVSGRLADEVVHLIVDAYELKQPRLAFADLWEEDAWQCGPSERM